MGLKEKLDANPWVLSHHPVCGRFRDHTVTLRGRQVCKGCLMTYPAAGLTLLVVLPLLHFSDPVPEGWVPWHFFLLLAVASELVDASRLAGHLPGRLDLVPRAFRGVSLGLMVVAMVVAPDVPTVLTLLALLCFGYGVSAYTAYRAFSACAGCPEEDNFPHCEGLQGILPGESRRRP